VEAPAQEPAASTRPKRKKASQAAREEKTRAKPERSAPRAADGPKESKPDGHGQQAADPIPRQALEAAPVIAASSLEDRWAGGNGPGGNRLATAAPGGSVGTETDAVVVQTSRVDGVAPAEAEANAVQLVDSNEINEIDRIAIEQESSWSVYLLLLLIAALAAASAVCLLPRLIRPAEAAALAQARSDDPIGTAERRSGSAFEDEPSRQSTLRAPALIRAARTGAAYTRDRMAA
jgi:hypothetical protein